MFEVRSPDKKKKRINKMAAWPALQHEVFSLISCICTYALVSPYNTPTYSLDF